MRQAKLQPRAAAAASAELTRELDERLKVFDKAVWVRSSSPAFPSHALTLTRASGCRASTTRASPCLARMTTVCG